MSKRDDLGKVIDLLETVIRKLEELKSNSSPEEKEQIDKAIQDTVIVANVLKDRRRSEKFDFSLVVVKAYLVYKAIQKMFGLGDE